MRTLEAKFFGPIRHGKVEFGDLTVLVGPQASGKSLFVQLFKLIQDAEPICKTLKMHGLEWSKSAGDFLALYFGSGMQSVWRDPFTRVSADGRRWDVGQDVQERCRQVLSLRLLPPMSESVFLIPAQRVLVLQDGWPSPALSRSVEAPYCVRIFSDTIRDLLDQNHIGREAIFPQVRRLRKEFRELVDSGIYARGKVKLEVEGMRKSLVLQPPGSQTTIPYSAWSAGQREFTPLLLGLYWLIPSASIAKQPGVNTVIIEEPEMGLHPQAIMSFCMLVLVLLHRGYKVIVSTHSPILLDVVWALQELRTCKEEVGVRYLKHMFQLHGKIFRNSPLWNVLHHGLGAECRTYFFDRRPKAKWVDIREISSLDPASEEEEISGWGGLSGLSGRVADLVGEALREGKR